MVPISPRSPNADLVDRVVSRERPSSHPSPMARSLERFDVIGRAFPHSRADTRRTLERSGAIRTFSAGQAIVHQGDESDLALVLDGHVAIRRTTFSGRQLIVRIVTRGGLAGILFGVALGDISPYIGRDNVEVRGLAVIVLGGMGSIPGAVAGGYLLGLIEVIALVTIGSNARAGVAFAALFLMLVLRPQGLFGAQVREKV